MGSDDTGAWFERRLAEPSFIIPEIADFRRQRADASTAAGRALRGRPIEGREASRRSGVLASEASEGSAERSSADDRREPRSVVRKAGGLP